MSALVLLYALSQAASVGPAEPAVQRPLEPAAVKPSTGSRELLLDLFAEAEKRYLEKDYAGALAVFARAYEQSQDPTCLANMARIHEDLGEYTQAADLYQRFLRHPLASPTDRETIARRLDLLPGARPPPPAPVVPTPKPAVVAAATPTPAPVPAPLAEPAPPATGQPPRDRPARPLIVSGGLALALSVPAFVASGFTFDRARRIEGELDRADFTSYDDRSAAIARGRESQWIAIATVAAGGALFVSGVVLTAVGSKRARATARALQRAALGLHLRF